MLCRFAATALVIVSITPGASTALSLTRPLVYEVDDRSRDLTLTDLDADGRLDILATNNAEGTVDILYRLSEEEIAESEEPDSKPHLQEELITGRVVDDLAVGDLDGDGLPDVVVGSERGGAAVFFQTEPRTFESARRLRAAGRFVLVADWDEDGGNELLAVSTRDRPAMLTCLEAGADRELRTRWSEPLTSGPGESPRLADWDGDGDRDLLWAPADATHVHVLANDGEGGVGGEQLIEVGQALDWAPLVMADEVALVTLEPASGISRLLVPGRSEEAESATSFGSARYVALPETDSADHVPLMTGAMGGSGDAIYLPARTEAEALVISVDEDRGIHRIAVPALREVTSVQRTPSGSLLLVSRAEGTVALATSSLDDPHPPQPLPLTLEPLAAVVGQFDATPTPDLIVIGRDDSELVAQISPWQTTDMALESEPLDLPELPSDDPTTMAAADINGDGREDMLIFYQYRAPVTCLQTDEGWRPLSDLYQIPATFFEGVGPNQLWVGDLDGDALPEVLLARGGLVRVLRFGDPPDVEVLAQINAPRPGAEFVAVAALAGDAQRPPAIFVLDRQEEVVLVCQRGAEGGWEITSEVEVQLRSPQRLALGDGDGDGVVDLAVKGSDAVGVFFGGLTHPPLEQAATRPSPLEEGRLALVDALAWDGGAPWAHLVDHRHHTLLIWAWQPSEGEWEDVRRFKVFETPLESRRDWERELERIEVEPREMAVGDTDGDGLDDLVLLAHDHLLIYPRGDEETP